MPLRRYTDMIIHWKSRRKPEITIRTSVDDTLKGQVYTHMLLQWYAQAFDWLSLKTDLCSYELYVVTGEMILHSTVETGAS